MSKRIVFSSLLALCLVLIALTGIASDWAADEIVTPRRRPLQDFHRKLIKEQDGHCLRIDRFTGSDGTPCLVVTPQGNPAKRGSLLRGQLAERGHNPSPYGQTLGTLVLIHGRKGRKEDYLAVAERFCAAGFRCVIPDFPGHGDHPGPTATYGIKEAGIPGLILREASEQFHFPTTSAGLMGISMGGSIAVHAAAHDPSAWRAIAIVASFDTLASSLDYQASRLAGDTLGPAWMSAADSMVRRRAGFSIHDVKPSSLAPRITIPALIVHGTEDQVVPLSSARRLFDSFPASSSKQWIEIPAANHDNVLITEFPIYATICGWMLDAISGK